MRPSVVFGAEDQFFNRLAALARLSPILPIFGQGLLDAGRSRVQPIYVGDVADAIVNVLDDPSSVGETYELGGPRIYSYREIMELVSRETGRKRASRPRSIFCGEDEGAVPGIAAISTIDAGPVEAARNGQRGGRERQRTCRIGCGTDVGRSDCAALSRTLPAPGRAGTSHIGLSRDRSTILKGETRMALLVFDSGVWD